MTTLREREAPNTPTTVFRSGDRMAEISPKTPPAVQKEACFNCRKVGHWSRDCPEKGGASAAAAAAAALVDYPTHYCRCGQGVCVVSVSKTPKNPGRKFYRCPRNGSESCNYFEWCDQLKEDQVRHSPPESSIPVCQCGAGVCTLTTDPSGRNCFICPIKKGQGACDFVQWQDIPNPTVNGESSALADISVTDNNVDDIEPDILGDPSDEILPKLGGVEANDTPGLSFDHEHPAHVVYDEGNLSESTAEGSLVFRLGNSSADNAQASNEFQLVKHSTVIAAPGESLSAGIKVQNYVLGNPHQLLNFFYFEGWWGEIAYPPPRSLIVPTKSWWDQIAYPPSRSLTVPTKRPFFPCIAGSPFMESTDSKIFEPEKRSKLDPSASQDLSYPVNLQSLHALGSIMAGTVSQAFGQLGGHIKENLITLLQSMDPSDHKKMLDEVATAVEALKCLRVDHEIFYERVKGYIKQAERLAKINEVKGSDIAEEELIKQYYSEKSRFDEISQAHSEAVVALAASSERLQSARKDASYLKGLLLKVEMELASREAETADLQARLVQITNKMTDSKKSWESASQAAAETLIRRERKEIKLSAAKAAFEKAKAHLKGECL